MNRREKIIITTVAVVAIAAVGDLLWSPSSSDLTSPSTTDDEPLAIQAQVQLSQITLPHSHRIVLEALDNPWTEKKLTPFPALSEEPETPPGDGSETAPTDLPAYTGYFNINDRHIAIVDGESRLPGEWLEDQSWQILEIQPTHLKISNPQLKTPIRIELNKP
ncbi:MAG: hypothetical protein JJT75_13270 [Opitutales bacterium]|nr:hypothetical protein [Opitutales bacterium]MCH8539729.1 hypothetical protein [Opitutales bacterium]